MRHCGVLNEREIQSEGIHIYVCLSYAVEANFVSNYTSIKTSYKEKKQQKNTKNLSAVHQIWVKFSGHPFSTAFARKLLFISGLALLAPKRAFVT